MLNNTTAAPENRQPCSWYRVGAPEEHLSGSVLLWSGTRVGAPEEPGSVFLRSSLLRSRAGNSQQRPSPSYRGHPPWNDLPPPPRRAASGRARRPKGRCAPLTPAHLRPRHVSSGPRLPPPRTGGRGRTSA